MAENRARRLLAMIEPSKPVGEMTDAEVEELARAIVGAAAKNK